MDDFHDKLKQMFSSREERDQRLAEILKAEDDLVSLVLRGHLVLEELLFSAVAAHCPTPKYLTDANLRFRQLVPMLRALEKIPAVPDWLWAALAELNTLRNSLAHRLELDDLSDRVNRFVATVPTPSDEEKRFPPPATQKAAVNRALHYIVGGLSVVAVFQSAMEHLIAHTIKQNAKTEPPSSPP